jgi:glycosyltransferase involved in cell wall biosynthesis
MARNATVLVHPARAQAGTAAGSMTARAHPRERGDASRVWTINGDFLTLQPTGVARYAREVTLALDALIASEHPLTRGLALDLVAPRQACEPLTLEAIPMRFVAEFRRPRMPQFWVQAQLPRHVRGGLLSFCNLAPVLVKRQIVCIHDLQTRLAPESYDRLFRWAHHLILPLLGRRVAHVTTVSQLSRDHLVKFGIAPPDKISITYNGSDHAARWEAGRSHLKVASRRPYVLCLGRRQKHKNIELLVRLAPLLDPAGIDIWMAGDIAERDIASIGGPKPRNIHLIGRIGDDDFKKALSGAICFLFPSRMEGFGLPAVEAMAAGCPVVASTSPCLPEVCGDAALYGDPDNPHAWAGLIHTIRNNAALRLRLVNAGYARARSYSWRGIAEAYLSLMAEIDLGKPGLLGKEAS